MSLPIASMVLVVPWWDRSYFARSLFTRSLSKSGLLRWSVVDCWETRLASMHWSTAWVAAHWSAACTASGPRTPPTPWLLLRLHQRLGALLRLLLELPWASGGGGWRNAGGDGCWGGVCTSDVTGAASANGASAAGAPERRGMERILLVPVLVGSTIGVSRASGAGIGGRSGSRDSP